MTEGLINDIDELKQNIKSSSKIESSVSEHAKSSDLGVPDIEMKLRRTLKGHIAKVYEFDFCQNNPDLIVSASQDGKLIVWNGLTTHKLYVIPLHSQWVLTCGMAPGGGLVACGGLDNTVYVYQLSVNSIPEQPTYRLQGHEGSISRVRFVDDEQAISTSGDKSQILWDINTQNIASQFFGHDADVLCLDISQDKNNYLTGSIDKTSKLWDIRTGEAVLNFTGHGSDINSIKYFPNQTAFATGSEDGTLRLYDIRGDRELMIYHQPENEDNFYYRISSLSFSSSGKYIFTGCHTCVYIWNTLTGEKIGEIGDNDIISCVGVNPSGNALYASSWNSFIKVYA